MRVLSVSIEPYKHDVNLEWRHERHALDAVGGAWVVHGVARVQHVVCAAPRGRHHPR